VQAANRARIVFLFFIIYACFALASSPARARSARWAVVAGNNLGGAERIPLRFAEEDARRLARVLTSLGGFEPDRVQMLLGKSPREFIEAIRRAQQGIAAIDRDRKSILLIYYSGHADGENLDLGDERLGLAELKSEAAAAGSDVSFIVLDACYSGAAARDKGGRSAPSFLRFAESPRASGRVILTSAAASELAQESDEIGSSFFTHYLVSGLMGDADRSGDRRVTLAELYRYVYDRTVNRTVDTLPGVQHPAFSYDLEGEGSIVLTDLNNESTGIVLPVESAGNYLLFDSGNSTVVAELTKHPGTRRMIPLSPGKYVLKKRLSSHLLAAEIRIASGELMTMTDQSMQRIEFDSPTSKGWDLALGTRARRLEAQALMGWTAFLRAPAGGIWSAPAAGAGVMLRGWPARNWNTRLSVVSGAWRHSLPLPERRLGFLLVFLETACDLGRALEYGPFALELGGRALVDFVQRRFDSGGYTGNDQSAGAGLGPYALFSVRLGRLRLAVDLSAGALFFPGADKTVVPYTSGGLTLGLGI